MNILFYHSGVPPSPRTPSPARSRELDTERKISSQRESELCTEFALFERTQSQIKELREKRLLLSRLSPDSGSTCWNLTTSLQTCFDFTSTLSHLFQQVCVRINHRSENKFICRYKQYYLFLIISPIEFSTSTPQVLDMYFFVIPHIIT